MHVRRDDVQDYLVWDQGMVYRYRAPVVAEPATEPMDPAPKGRNAPGARAVEVQVEAAGTGPGWQAG